MNKPLFQGGMPLSREVVIIDDHGERKLYQLKCSRRKLLALLDAMEGWRDGRPA
jgi:hypothetical protein